MVIDDSLKEQIQIQTLPTCRLFVLTQIFQYISNWPNVFEHLSTLFFSMHREIIFSNFSIYNFSVDYVGLYINWASTSLFIIPDIVPTLKLPIEIHPSSR